MGEEFDRPLRVAASGHESRVQISDFLRHESNPPAITIISDKIKSNITAKKNLTMTLGELQQIKECQQTGRICNLRFKSTADWGVHTLSQIHSHTPAPTTLPHLPAFVSWHHLWINHKWQLGFIFRKYTVGLISRKVGKNVDKFIRRLCSLQIGDTVLD